MEKKAQTLSVEELRREIRWMKKHHNIASSKERIENVINNTPYANTTRGKRTESIRKNAATKASGYGRKDNNIPEYGIKERDDLARGQTKKRTAGESSKGSSQTFKKDSGLTRQNGSNKNSNKQSTEDRIREAVKYEDEGQVTNADRAPSRYANGSSYKSSGTSSTRSSAITNPDRAAERYTGRSSSTTTRKSGKDLRKARREANNRAFQSSTKMKR